MAKKRQKSKRGWLRNTFRSDSSTSWKLHIFKSRDPKVSRNRRYRIAISPQAGQQEGSAKHIMYVPTLVEARSAIADCKYAWKTHKRLQTVYAHHTSIVDTKKWKYVR